MLIAIRHPEKTQSADQSPHSKISQPAGAITALDTNAAKNYAAVMHIIATDILGDVCGLSLGLIMLVIPVGLVLWLLGWWSHRFWIVLATTVIAGIVGLNEA